MIIAVTVQGMLCRGTWGIASVPAISDQRESDIQPINTVYLSVEPHEAKDSAAEKSNHCDGAKPGGMGW